MKRAFRSVFFGTPEIAVPALRALADTSELVGVVCQPDRPKGRGLEVQEPAVKRAARELGVDVHQPLKVKTGNLDEWLRERSIEPQALMDAADAVDARVWGFVALVACRGKNDVAWNVIKKKGLEHHDPSIRAATLSALTRVDARQSGRELDRLLGDPDPNVRRIGRDLVVRRGDPGPGPALAALLERRDLDEKERKSVIAAVA